MLEISFVIPMYNTPEEKLRRCFDSIAGIQEITYEVILVDDGSAASMGDFCKTYVQEKENFHYYYKENGGASAARNFGIEKAQGKYIAFVDSDDIVVGEAYSAADLALDADFYIYDMLYTGDSGKGSFPFPGRAAGAVTGAEIVTAIFRDNSIGGPVAKLYRRSIVAAHGVRFDVDMKVAEDADFVCNFLYHAKTMYYCGRTAYYYDFSPATGNGRFLQFPDVFLANYRKSHVCKMQALDVFSFTPEEAVLCRNLIGNRTIQLMFECAGVLLNHKLLPKERRKAILQLADEAMAVTTERFGLKNTVYCFMLRHRLWAGILLVEKLRVLYAKYRS